MKESVYEKANAGDAQSPTNPPNGNRYISPTPGEIPIIAATPTRNDEIITRENFLEISDCGFNAVYTGKSINTLVKSFEDVIDTGIKIIPAQQSFNLSTLKQLVENFGDNPNLGCWRLKDERTYIFRTLLNQDNA